MGLSGGVCPGELQATQLSDAGCASERVRARLKTPEARVRLMTLEFRIRLMTLEYLGGGKLGATDTASVWSALRFSTKAAPSEEYRGGGQLASSLLLLRRGEAVGCRWLCCDLMDMVKNE